MREIVRCYYYDSGMLRDTYTVIQQTDDTILHDALNRQRPTQMEVSLDWQRRITRRWWRN